jgi:hypothetical protein
MRIWGVRGIAFSTSLVVLLNALVVVLLRPELRSLLRQRDLGLSLLRAAIATSCMALCILWLPSLPGWPVDRAALTLAARASMGLLVYALALVTLRGGEIGELRTALKRRGS